LTPLFLHASTVREGERERETGGELRRERDWSLGRERPRHGDRVQKLARMTQPVGCEQEAAVGVSQ